MNTLFCKEDLQMSNRYTKKVLNIINHWRKANLNDNEISPSIELYCIHRVKSGLFRVKWKWKLKYPTCSVKFSPPKLNLPQKSVISGKKLEILSSSWSSNVLTILKYYSVALPAIKSFTNIFFNLNNGIIIKTIQLRGWDPHGPSGS